MPVDARIALAGIPQEYNAFGAYNTSRAAEQTFRQNQMIQQAARDTAEMNRNAMAAAQTLDPTDQAAMRAYVARYGPAAAPIIEGLSGVDNMFTARNTDARAQGEFDTKQRVDLRDFLQREVGSFLNDPSDANIAASRARAIAAGIDAADFDAYVAPYTALPVEQRPDRLRNELATSADGLKLLERFAPAYDMQNAGGSIVPVQTNPLAPGATPPRPITVTADPNRQQLVQDANGNWVSVNPNTGGAAPVTLPGGAPVTGQTRREEDDPAGAAAAAARAAAPGRLEGAQNLTRLIDEAAANTNYFTAGLGSLTAVIPGTPAADLAGTMESIKSNLAFDRLQQMRDESRTGGALGQIVLRELDMLASVWASTQQSQSPQQLRENLGILRTRSEALVAAYKAMVDAGGGGAPAGGGGAGGGQVAYDAQGNRFVVRNGQWVRE